MALPSSGPLQLGTQSGGSSINSEFQYGNDMASYQGVYYGRGGLEFRFPVPGNPIDMDTFHGATKITGGSASLGAGNWTVPLYNQITLSVAGGNGGGGGQDGVSSCFGAGANSGNNGNAGGGATIGGYVNGAGGGGGSHGSNTSPGGSGTSQSITFTNPAQGGNGPPSGTVVSVSTGTAGNQGTGGYNAYYNNYYKTCAPGTQQASGANGNAGYANAAWS